MTEYIGGIELYYSFRSDVDKQYYKSYFVVNKPTPASLWSSLVSYFTPESTKLSNKCDQSVKYYNQVFNVLSLIEKARLVNDVRFCPKFRWSPNINNLEDMIKSIKESKEPFHPHRLGFRFDWKVTCNLTELKRIEDRIIFLKESDQKNAKNWLTYVKSIGDKFQYVIKKYEQEIGTVKVNEGINLDLLHDLINLVICLVNQSQEIKKYSSKLDKTVFQTVCNSTDNIYNVSIHFDTREPDALG